MIKNYDYTCIECHHEINNPICPSCILREIKAWNSEIGKKLENIFNESGMWSNFGVKCIICKKNFDLCQYCFTKSLSEEISKFADKKLFFDFSLLFENWGKKSNRWILSHKNLKNKRFV